MVRFNDVVATTDAIESGMVGFCIVDLMPLTSTASATKTIASSHPPQRPLPKVADDLLTRGRKEKVL
jgi:hypothetical protein